MNVADFRLAVVAALSSILEVESGDWTVLEQPYDAFDPPAFVPVWGPDPWRATDTVCSDAAQLQVVAVSQRLTPEATYPVLEAMVDAATSSLAAARLRPYQTLSPAPYEVANVTYLAARIQLRQPVDIGGQ